MNSDLESWVTTISTSYSDAIPDMHWSHEIADNVSIDENDHFESFHKFVDFPVHDISLDLMFEASILSETQEFKNTAKELLRNINKLNFSQVSNFAVLAVALRNDSSLLDEIPNDANIVEYVWCASQCLENDLEKVSDLWNNCFMSRSSNRSSKGFKAILLLMEIISRKWEDIEVPPLGSDKYEYIFAIAYGRNESHWSVNSRKHAAFVLPQLIPLVAGSNASHLFFRRMLPYCAMENDEGRRSALDLLEQIIGHSSQFPSCISTWITMHPYCVAASNNLLVDIERRGIMTTQMKPLLKQIMRINKLMLKDKIKLLDETKYELPRSLWRVEFPPPKDEVEICNKTCKLVMDSFESKWKTIIPLLIIVLITYLLYIYK
jgi:hypothetical protein